MIKSIIQISKMIVSNRNLAWELAKREITDRYSGSYLGILWSIIHPLVLLLVYIVVFSYVFKLKVGGTHEMPFDYTTYLVSGYIPWMFFSEGISKASTSFTGQANLVKQVVFPIAILPVKGILSSLISFAIGIILLLVYIYLKYGFLHKTVVLLPLAFILIFILVTGLGLILSTIGVFIKDLKDVIIVLLLIGAYCLPIFFLPEWVPDSLIPFIKYNPFSHLIYLYQDILYYGSFHHFYSWFVISLLSVFTYLIGCILFNKFKPYFSDFL